MPSTTYSGVAEAFTDPMPRMMTDAASPGWPPPEATWTPATVPSNDLLMLPTTRFLQLVALDYGGRTGERLLLGRTVGHDHHAFDPAVSSRSVTSMRVLLPTGIFSVL